MNDEQLSDGLYLGYQVYERGPPGFRCHDTDYFTIPCNTLFECAEQLDKVKEMHYDSYNQSYVRKWCQFIYDKDVNQWIQCLHS